MSCNSTCFTINYINVQALLNFLSYEQAVPNSDLFLYVRTSGWYIRPPNIHWLWIYYEIRTLLGAGDIAVYKLDKTLFSIRAEIPLGRDRW